MSKVTREEMLACIKAYQEFDLFPDRRWDDELNAILALIEHGPEVSRGLVEKWAKKIDGDYGDFTTRADPTRDNLLDMLHEIPVTVKEGK